MFLVKKIKYIKRKRKVTFEKVVEEWLEMKKEKVKITTYSNYLYSMNNYFIERFKNCTLKDLEKYDYKQMIDEMSQVLSTRTLRDNISKLKSVLYFSNIKYGTKINLKELITPTVEQEPVSIFSEKEKIKLEKYCINQENLKCIGVIIVMNTGLRIGEICALKWKNIDLEKREIRIRQTAERVYDETEHKTKLILINPKSRNSVRNIPISNKLYSVLVKFKNQSPENFFLTGSEIKIMEPRTYLSEFKKILKKSKIKKNYRFHALRHTFATNCIDAGMDAKSLSEILGHSSIKVTLERYVHSSYKIKKKYLEKI